uniref:endo-polygalacturonase n=1 Tax=Agroathelia rolfsii TaxID=39291 RepID=B7XH72_9AGAM|nr:endopolygalacturonase 1 precursor [Agroathelia rolfsii]
MPRVSTVLGASLFLASAVSAVPYANSTEPVRIGKRCTSTISSLSDVTDSALECTTINIKSFSVPAGKTFDISNLADGTTVNLLGDVTFGYKEWDGPLFQIGTKSKTATWHFNGNGHTLNGQGAQYWDGKGTNGGKTKPHPMVKLYHGTGSFKDVTVLNSPAQAVSVGTSAAFTISGVTIDNSAGSSKGHNTDCFDVSADDVTITGNVCKNQDDCLAVNKGSNIEFSDNKCSGGHGISIGSVKSDHNVESVTISGNTVTDSANGLRIKTVYGATDAAVTNIVYKDNTVSGISKYGVVIEQDYENGSPTGKPSNGVTLGPVTFEGTNKVSVNSGAKEVYVLCGSKCTGTWDWSGLSVSGGSSGSINYDHISNFKL